MLLEIADNPNETVAELSVLKKSFPKTWRKMIEHLRNKPHKLKFGGLDLYDASGFGPAIDGLTHAFKEETKRGNINVEVDFHINGKTYSEALPIHDSNLVAVYYDHERDRILLGYDAWVSPEDFGDSFDKFFEQDTGEVFDHDNDEHSWVFDQAAREFNKMGMIGLLVIGYFDGMRPFIDVDYEGEKGFFKGIEPSIQHMDLIQL